MLECAVVRIRMILWYGFNPLGLGKQQLPYWQQEMRDMLRLIFKTMEA